MKNDEGKWTDKFDAFFIHYPYFSYALAMEYDYINYSKME